ncbi:hypothetical protein SESBI_17718 [Sesbania bispinosa]|nr:hypothetical protein SESBI_17718 [Sesbania bispinosa]
MVLVPAGGVAAQRRSWEELVPAVVLRRTVSGNEATSGSVAWVGTGEVRLTAEIGSQGFAISGSVEERLCGGSHGGGNGSASSCMGFNWSGKQLWVVGEDDLGCLYWIENVIVVAEGKMKLLEDEDGAPV